MKTVIMFAAGLWFGGSDAGAVQAPFNPQACFACHSEVSDLWGGGKHKGKLSCVQCHGKLDAHLKSPENKPETNLDPALCGKCHKNQFDTFFKTNLKKPARLEKSLLTERSPNPFWDKLMAGHGFTKEHNAPRSHAYMVVDHLVVDRAFGGRFQPKDGWKYVNAKGPVKAWDLLEDRYPDDKEHKPFLTESAAAANPTCMKCKTSDTILKWKYLGDKDERTPWSRASNPVQYAKEINNVMGCIHCHDPHGTKPRIVRDGLLAALTRPEADTLWHKDPRRTKVEVVDFRGFRKIGILEKNDSKLQCAQCHVEYNCNTGTDPKTGAKVDYDDQRTNHFPLKDVFQIYEHYNALGFRDFKHTLTGGLLFKGQHPEAEVFWNSKHDKAGVSCKDCHMPKMTGKDGKAFTSHWQTSPRNYIKETCLSCHKEWSAGEAVYAIDSVK
ncbi:MAG: ammonia-forming cytochrome c nitrite reductase subunit c552, partial [Actinomycetota bacterium]